MAGKQPLKFNLDNPAPTATATAHVSKSKAAPEPTVEDARKQVGARIPMTLYRRLKAHAALQGQPVQIIVEAAVIDYLKQHEQ